MGRGSGRHEARAKGGLELLRRGAGEIWSAAEKNYIKTGGRVEVKGGLLRPHDLPLAIRLKYNEIIDAALRCRNPARAAESLLAEAPPEMLYIYKYVERRRIAELSRRQAVHVAAMYYAERCNDCEGLDVFYLPGRGVVYVPRDTP